MITVGDDILVGGIGGASVTLSTATPQPLGTAAAGSTGEVSDAGHVHATPTGFASGATTAEPMTGTGWTTTPVGTVTATWGSGKLVLDAPTGASALTTVERDTAPLDSRAAEWDVVLRVQVTAGDGTTPRGQMIVRWYESAGNLFSLVFTSTRQIGLTSSAGGGDVDHGFVAGPSSGEATGGQLHIRLTRLRDGIIAAWWGVGTGGAMPTLWTRTHLIDRGALTAAVGPAAKLRLIYGWFGEGGVGATWTTDVLAIRTSWQGSL